jgi:hypothetical protein
MLRLVGAPLADQEIEMPFTFHSRRLAQLLLALAGLLSASRSEAAGPAVFADDFAPHARHVYRLEMKLP